MEREDDEMPDSYNIIQITDWHVDLNYLEGSNKKCNYEICCQKEWGMPESPGDAARKYGEVTCDIPFVTAVKQIESLLEYERDVLKPKNEKIDLILWTGDSISHDLHHTNQQHTLETINLLT